MAEPGAKPPPPKFPTRPSGPVLALPRRHASRAPFVDPNGSPNAAPATGEWASRLNGGGRAPVSSENQAELERSLRQLQLLLAERERVVVEAEARLVERDRDIAEAEALLIAREKLAAASAVRRNGPAPVMSAQEKEALEQMKAALDKQEVTIQEARQGIKEREQFLEESETRLFAKVQTQQEKEIELEQREEDLQIRERQFRESMAAVDPGAAAALKAEDAASNTHDEFSE
jgi:hypothetical protein